MTGKCAVYVTVYIVFPERPAGAGAEEAAIGRAGPHG
jgi:hypothetical protein